MVLFLKRATNADMREKLLKALYLLLFYEKNNRSLWGEENEGEHWIAITELAEQITATMTYEGSWFVIMHGKHLSKLLGIKF